MHCMVEAAEEAGEALPGTETAAEKSPPAKPAKAAAKGDSGKADPDDPAKYPSKEAIGPFCAH